jgi:Mn-containing catalase
MTTRIAGAKRDRALWLNPAIGKKRLRRQGPEARRFMQEGAHRRLYRFSPNDYAEILAIWGNGEQALPGDPPGKLEVVDGHPDGGKIPELAGISAAFTPDYQPEEIFEIANKLYTAFKS